MKVFSILISQLASIIILYRGFKNRSVRFFLKKKFNKCGKNVSFDAQSKFSYKSISLGNDIYIGPNAIFSASGSHLTISDKVLFGPNVTIMCGNHNAKVIGKYMFDVHEKMEDDDLPVVIEEDVWIGANVVILKGVTIARGSIVGAGSLVTKSTLPYSINIGAPAKLHKFRWSKEEIKIHESKL